MLPSTFQFILDMISTKLVRQKSGSPTIPPKKIVPYCYMENGNSRFIKVLFIYLFPVMNTQIRVGVYNYNIVKTTQCIGNRYINYGLLLIIL